MHPEGAPLDPFLGGGFPAPLLDLSQLRWIMDRDLGCPRPASEEELRDPEKAAALLPLHHAVELAVDLFRKTVRDDELRVAVLRAQILIELLQQQ